MAATSSKWFSDETDRNNNGQALLATTTVNAADFRDGVVQIGT